MHVHFLYEMWNSLFHLWKWQHKLSKTELEFSVFHMKIYVQVFLHEIVNFMFHTYEKLGVTFSPWTVQFYIFPL